MDVIAEIPVGDVREKVDQGQDQRQPENRDNVEVVRRVPASVIRQCLGFLFGHVQRLLAGRRASVAESAMIGAVSATRFGRRWCYNEHHLFEAEREKP
jgi:hypothetical protein